ncbi:unnamed protein product, partial [Coregonus sp. 'balchen']
NGSRLSVVTEQSKVVSRRGGNTTLPCKFHRDASLPTNPKLRIKWTKLTSDYLKEVDVFVAMGFHKRSYGRIVYPYFPRLGRYNLNFFDAERACRDQDSIVASFDQLYEAWRGGLDWCNAGWLSDGSVQYPITTPREPCGGKNTKDGAQIAKVGQMYAAWKLLGYDRCDAGWLADGSVRYPITRPRRRCSPAEAAVRFNGYPDKKQKLYGVYCLKGHN